MKANADAQYQKVKAKGFDAIIKQSGNLYRVQVGAYSVKANAEAQAAKLRTAGFETYITTTGGTQVTAGAAPAPVLKSIDVIAKEVIAGKWGNGEARKQKLTAAGYNYATVQQRVNQLLK